MPATRHSYCWVNTAKSLDKWLGFVNEIWNISKLDINVIMFYFYTGEGFTVKFTFNVLSRKINNFSNLKNVGSSAQRKNKEASY